MNRDFRRNVGIDVSLRGVRNGWDGDVSGGSKPLELRPVQAIAVVRAEP